MADQVTDVYGVSTPEDAWAYFKFPNAGHGFDTTYIPTRSDVANSQFLSFVVTPATGAWGGSEFFADEDTVFVFATIVRSTSPVTIPLVWTGDDGHSVFVNGEFVGGGGFGEDVPFDLTVEPDAPVKLELVGYNGPGPWVFHFVRRDTGLPLTSTPGISIEASTEDVPTCLWPPAGLVSWWPGDGNTRDIIGGRDALFRGDATTVPGHVGAAFILDGDEDFVDVPHHPALNVGTGDFTVDLWVYFNNTAGEQVLIEKYVENFELTPPGWFLTKLDGNSLRFGTGPAAEGHGVDSAPLSLPDNTWIHVAARRRSGMASIFVNGVEVATAPFVDNADSDASLKFGHRGSPDDTPGSTDTRGFFLNGRIDEVELFAGRALSDAEIQAIFNAGSAGKCKIVNGFVAFEPIPSTYRFTTDATGCPAGFVGIFSFDARLTNSSEGNLANLHIAVAELTDGNMLLTEDSLLGEGERFEVPQRDGFTDARLSPGELVDVPFAVCLQERRQFRLLVDVFGTVLPPVPAVTIFTDPQAFQAATLGVGTPTVIDFEEVDASPVNDTYVGREEFDGQFYAARGVSFVNPEGLPLFIAPRGLFWNVSNSLSVLRFPFDPADPALGEDDDLVITFDPPCTAVGITFVDNGEVGRGNEFVQFKDTSGRIVAQTGFPPDFTSFRAFLGVVSPDTLIADIHIVEAPTDGDDVNYDAITCIR